MCVLLKVDSGPLNAISVDVLIVYTVKSSKLAAMQNGCLLLRSAYFHGV